MPLKRQRKPAKPCLLTPFYYPTSLLFNSFEDSESALNYLRQSFEIFNELGHPMKTEVGKKIIFIEVKQALDNK